MLEPGKLPQSSQLIAVDREAEQAGAGVAAHHLSELRDEQLDRLQRRRYAPGQLAAILFTANHYMLDATAGLAVARMGLLIAMARQR